MSNDKVIENLINTVQMLPASVLVGAIDGDIIGSNKAFQRQSGWNEIELVGKQVQELRANDEAVYQAMKDNILRGQNWSGEVLRKHKNGHEYYEYVTVAPVADDNGEYKWFVSVHDDVSERRNHERRLIKQAHFDNLTQLPNRIQALDRLILSCSFGMPFSILFIDLDGFKNVNDTLGHTEGDEALKEAASRLVSATGPNDLIARLGGDEFLIILETPGNKAAERVADKLVQDFSGPIQTSTGHRHNLGVSIGIACYPDDGEDAEEILSAADMAMYDAKEGGRNTWRHHDKSKKAALKRESDIRDWLSEAIQNQYITPWFQPIVDIQNESKLAGFEALSRWVDPVHGFISPAEFIPCAEKYGQVRDIGIRVLESSIATCALWRRYHPDIWISVNVSPIQITDGDLPEIVGEFLERYNLPGNALALEITEGVLLENDQNVTRTIQKLDEYGCMLVLDDFGTGYSALSYLQKFPFRKLKIDKSFIDDIEKSNDKKRLAEAIISMSHALGMDTVAEGIEEADQNTILKDIGCPHGQGWHYGRPVPEEEALKMVIDATR